MTSSQSAVSYSDQQLSKSYQQMSREAQEMKRRRRRRFQSQVTVVEADLMSNVEQEADNSKRNSEESDAVLKNQQIVRVQKMATVEWIQQKRKSFSVIFNQSRMHSKRCRLNKLI
ncbi:eukaryotic peptide chain release factor subunit 1-3-like [Dorcoceras hygrometricum]|uniref:Eukaryotic peptide chain release factor subunit 1-3-like n=1 Tax=Dorcoceras hygrometricum TaxID=472368 RepID=A0A2Z7BDV6_9LAMI|nr:eukaryotic peptide chain release factor subunit 1-3-like [Dorcoceras hygrometricum]